MGESEGNFSPGGWLDDLEAVVASASNSSAGGGTWVVGAGTSGALAVSLAAKDKRVRGIACLAAPATFSDWARDPGALAALAREVGVISTGAEPPDLSVWSRDLTALSPSSDALLLRGRPVLVLHGTDDDVVPVEDARGIAEAVGETAELRILAGAGHRLNSDPRAIALLLGWLERQRT
jgi:putative redox protein